MNTKLQEQFADVGVHIPEILLPSKGTDMAKWSVVACDQYTSQPEYWDDVERIAGQAPSTLRLTLPEIYLEDNNVSGRIENINRTMDSYLDKKLLEALEPGFIYVERTLPGGAVRHGLIIAIDLEYYDYTKGSQTIIRATEATVVERIPPRVRIREGAAIELPHVMLLIDDRNKTVIEPLAGADLEKLYDFRLMKNGGHIKGYHVKDAAALGSIAANLKRLASPDLFRKRYCVGEDKGVLLFAAGDGNHSLASAKCHWETVKKGLSAADACKHPARFALVEVVNVHDDGLIFHPINRVVFNAGLKDLMQGFTDYYKNSSAKSLLLGPGSDPIAEARKLSENSIAHIIPFTSGREAGILRVENPNYNLTVGTLQTFLDDYLRKNPGISIDYIHGDDIVAGLSAKERNIGFYLPAMDKKDLFKTVVLEGVLPRKTFSMGEAEEKRYYLESRRIK